MTKLGSHLTTSKNAITHAAPAYLLQLEIAGKSLAYFEISEASVVSRFSFYVSHLIGCLVTHSFFH